MGVALMATWQKLGTCSELVTVITGGDRLSGEREKLKEPVGREFSRDLKKFLVWRVRRGVY